MGIESEKNANTVKDAADASMVGMIRLVLSASALLTIFIDPSSAGRLTIFTWYVFFGYNLHSLILYVLSHRDQPFLQSKLIHWLDIFWYTLIITFTGGSNSPFFLFFFFAILTSSFRWGFEEGARVTLASAVLFSMTIMASDKDSDLSRMLLRTTFMLALGHMIAYWGGSEVAQKRRLELLRNVSRLSNPRFGIDHTIASVLEQTRVFFNASNCLLVMCDGESENWSLRTDMADGVKHSVKATQINAEAAAPLMAFPQDQIIIYNRPLRLAPHWTGESIAFDTTELRWIKIASGPAENLAELLEAHCFICVPLSLRTGKGSIFLTSQKQRFSKAEALFLSHIGEQTFPVIENIKLLDQMVSEAALRERKKIAHDLHDTAIQPYIGLKLGLTALRNKATNDNPLNEDLDKLSAMTTQVINDLRRYAGNFNKTQGFSESEYLIGLKQQAAQMKEFYGIDITVSIEGELGISDRMAAEAFQIIIEGMSNIRKHSSARYGCIKLKCSNGSFDIHIENECLGAQPFEFMPNSIRERTNSLGGNTKVWRTTNGNTVVHVSIPI